MTEASNVSEPVQVLLDRGVCIHNPGSVWVDASLDPDNIDTTATIYPGCRISGDNTSIGPSCVIGEEQPATIVDCQLAGNVSLKGGFFSGAVFLDGASAGPQAHIRPATILEEEASCAHAVGLKQTILMPYVTLGSLINFCDCLMAGGTSRKNHSEVGSSFIHFNYTPHQDKATPSLIGDVPRGVMLDQSPIFLGGQGGLVGPRQIEYGTITAAGTICRRDIIEPGKLIKGSSNGPEKEIDYNPKTYTNLNGIITSNLSYIGNLHALASWYIIVRSLFMKKSPFSSNCLSGASRQIKAMINERARRLHDLLEKTQGTQSQRNITTEIEACPEGNSESRDILLKELSRNDISQSYLEAVKNLSPSSREAGRNWLKSIVDATMSTCDI